MPITRLIVASANPGKAAEIAGLLASLPVEVASLADFPQVALPEETGTTFAENAALKARAVALALGEWSLADDSGLAVTALDGAPGVHSSRIADTDAARIAWLLGRLAGVPEERRAAQFVCAVALADPAGRLVGVWEGRVEGRILPEPRGSRGFGYDPVFFYPPAGKTFAEMLPEEKGTVSHRGRALRQFRTAFRCLLEAETTRE